MPTRAEYYRSAPSPNPIHQEERRSPSGYLARSYWPADSHGDRIAKAGTLLAALSGGLSEWAMTGATPYFVPYSPTAAYGTGSDTAAGILAGDYDVTVQDWQITIVTSGIAYERYCLVAGGVRGDIPAAAKTNLSNIEWR